MTTAGERAARDDEQRVRALRKRLALDFRPLRDALARGLDVLIDPEAAVLCTATVEALCDALFHVVVKNLHDDAAVSLAPLDTRVTVYHLHVALRSHSDFVQLLAGVDRAAAVLECFLDDASSRALYERHLLATPEAKHLRPSPLAASADSLPLPVLADDHEEDEELALHARTRSEWQKRADDPFSDVDFATVLKCVHPACTLAHSATLLLSALVRELLNTVCDRCPLEHVARRVPPELFVEDVAAPLARVFHIGDLGRALDKTAHDALARFRLCSRQGGTLALRCRVFASGAAARVCAATHTLPPVARDAPLGPVVEQMCKKCRVDAATHVAVYRGHAVDATATARALGMPATGAVVYLVRATWWDHTRRNDARRGLLRGAARGPVVPLMDTLDEAWLGFAGISANVRSMNESLQNRLAEEGRGGGSSASGVDALENELRARLEKTGELVRQTSFAHELVAQLLQGTGRLRREANDHPR